MNPDFIRIQNLIQFSQKPFLIGRIACGSEPKVIGSYKLNKTCRRYDVNELKTNAGIFVKNEDSLKEYIDEYYNAIINSDLLGVWLKGITYNMTKMIYDTIHTYDKDIEKNYFDAPSLEPYYHMDYDEYNFDKIIQGKKLLIISSHINSMQKQIPYLDKLFKKKIFDNNTFIFVKPPITFANNDNNIDWKINFDKLKNDISNIHFDLALVSCGGYGMPICNFIKNDLKNNAFYVGGCLQIFFGIKGDRWNKHNKISKLYNKFWIDVCDEDKPENYKMIENGCYW